MIFLKMTDKDLVLSFFYQPFLVDGRDVRRDKGWVIIVQNFWYCNPSTYISTIIGHSQGCWHDYIIELDCF